MTYVTYGMNRVVFWDPAEPTATRSLAVNVIGDQVYFPTVDLTKNVCELVDFYGNVAATYDYAPFGAVSAGTPSGASVPAEDAGVSGSARAGNLPAAWECACRASVSSGFSEIAETAKLI